MEAGRPMSLAWGATAMQLVLDPVLAVVFPSWCAACGAPLGRPTRAPLCEGCWVLPRHRGPVCRCGFALPAGAEAPCGRCRRGLTPFEAGASLGPYEAGLRTLVHELKYRGRRRIADRLAALMLAEASVERLLEGRPLLVPVPLHPRRLRARGFNQAELIARAIARGAGLALESRALVRRHDTPPQAGLSAVQRRRNVRGAFAAPLPIAARPVVLVDDVFTTGATARACAAALREQGATEVRVVTAARVR
jgi:ComF family protein